MSSNIYSPNPQCAVMIVLLPALTVIITPPEETYQFLPLRSKIADSSRISFRQKSTTSILPSKERLRLIRSTPNSVVCKSLILTIPFKSISQMPCVSLFHKRLPHNMQTHIFLSAEALRNYRNLYLS